MEGQKGGRKTHTHQNPCDGLWNIDFSLWKRLFAVPVSLPVHLGLLHSCLLPSKVTACPGAPAVGSTCQMCTCFVTRRLLERNGGGAAEGEELRLGESPPYLSSQGLKSTELSTHMWLRQWSQKPNPRLGTITRLHAGKGWGGGGAVLHTPPCLFSGELNVMRFALVDQGSLPHCSTDSPKSGESITSRERQHSFPLIKCSYWWTKKQPDPSRRSLLMMPLYPFHPPTNRQ